jgi:hypothetical protein
MRLFKKCNRIFELISAALFDIKDAWPNAERVYRNSFNATETKFYFEEREST